MKCHILIAGVLFLTGVRLQAQMPITDIYLIPIFTENSTFGEPLKITDNPGYDNQPEFSYDGRKILYTASHDSNQTDVYEYDISSGRTNILNYSPIESEYSPRYLNSASISFVRVNKEKSQHLCIYDTISKICTQIVRNIDSVGYYRFLNDTLIALAVLNEGMDLVLYRTNTHEHFISDNGIGRCLIKNPTSGELCYTRKDDEGKVKLMIGGHDQPFATGIGDTEDYAYTPSGILWAGNGGKLYKYLPDDGGSWVEIADFSASIGNFYRLTVSNDGRYLAVVSFTGKKP